MGGAGEGTVCVREGTDRVIPSLLLRLPSCSVVYLGQPLSSSNARFLVNSSTTPAQLSGVQLALTLEARRTSSAAGSDPRALFPLTRLSATVGFDASVLCTGPQGPVIFSVSAGGSRFVSGTTDPPARLSVAPLSTESDDEEAKRLTRNIAGGLVAAFAVVMGLSFMIYIECTSPKDAFGRGPFEQAAAKQCLCLDRSVKKLNGPNGRFTSSSATPDDANSFPPPSRRPPGSGASPGVVRPVAGAVAVDVRTGSAGGERSPPGPPPRPPSAPSSPRPTGHRRTSSGINFPNPLMGLEPSDFPPPVSPVPSSTVPEAGRSV